ncbi:MAG: glutamyl-Q tRNA(Asp) synthetase [Verrucomicrobiales bacterium]|jgi:glutamyl-Q tRNA(Asp) synthetase
MRCADFDRCLLANRDFLAIVGDSRPMIPQITRFAPSPTGRLHLGHAYSALVAWDLARKNGGELLLRIEDIDTTRCRPEFIEGIYEDLAWLGLSWPEPVRVQSEHLEDYQSALSELERGDLIYPCFCTRKEIQLEIARAGAAPHGPEGALYPGLCRRLSLDEREAKKSAGTDFALRLDVEKAQQLLGTDLTWTDQIQGEIRAEPESLGDVVLARKDIGTSYHLAVTVDDAMQGVTLVSRGEDLFHTTHIHRLLQALLELPVPLYHHHKLLKGEDGKRFAKRDLSQTLKSMREAGVSPDEIRERCGFNNVA